MIIILAALVGGGALWWGAGKRYDDAVAELAPAFVGCDTTLVFERTGTYTFFVETKGDVGRVDGDCAADGRSYESFGDTPRVALRLVDGRGDEVDLDRASGPTYDRDGHRGVGVRTAQIDETGDYVLTATAEDPDVVVRVGRDPAAGVTALRIGALSCILAGLIGGILLLVLGRPRPAPVVQPTLGPTWPYGPQPPPLGPPSAAPPAAPPYVPRPPSYAPPPAPATRPEPGRPPGGWPGGGRPLPPPTPPATGE